MSEGGAPSRPVVSEGRRFAAQASATRVTLPPPEVKGIGETTADASGFPQPRRCATEHAPKARSKVCPGSMPSGGGELAGVYDLRAETVNVSAGAQTRHHRDADRRARPHRQFETSAKAAGIHKSTYYSWMGRGEAAAEAEGRGDPVSDDEAAFADLYRQASHSLRNVSRSARRPSQAGKASCGSR